MRLSLILVPLVYGSCLSAQVVITQETNRVSIQIDKQPPIGFYYGPEVTKPYLYPLRAPSGAIVTRQWPMDPQPGESHDHIHHRGVWFAHSNVNGFDFWNSDPSYHDQHMGHIVVSNIDNVRSGAKSGSVTAELDWDTPSNEVLLHEVRTMTFYSGDPRIIDFDFELTAKQPVKFGDDKDGVFGLRVAPALEAAAKTAPPVPVRTGVMTSSNGCHQEAECWGKRADWVDVSGTIEGRSVGISIFENPANPRYPTYWHVRGYGLLANNIFGVKAFTKDSNADGSMSLQTGSKLHFRYRVVIHSGDASAAGVASLYSSYTKTGSTNRLR